MIGLAAAQIGVSRQPVPRYDRGAALVNLAGVNVAKKGMLSGDKRIG